MAKIWRLSSRRLALMIELGRTEWRLRGLAGEFELSAVGLLTETVGSSELPLDGSDGWS